MDTPQQREVGSTRARAARLWHAIAALEPSTQFAIASIVLGWFFMNTLVVTLGLLEHGVRFFDMAAVLADPARLFFGVDSWFARVWFGVLCLACALAPALAFPARGPAGLPSYRWLAYLAPLALMVVSGTILYAKTSGDFLTTPPDAASMTGSIVHFANALVKRGGGVVSRHIAVGSGAYLAFFGSAVLATQGFRGYRRRAAERAAAVR